jgi:prophage regulatory protein
MHSNLLRPKAAAAKAGISVSHLYHLVALNEFPQRIKISQGISAFLESEIDEWIARKIEASRSGK